MMPFGKGKSELTEKISEAAKNIGAMTGAALLIACAALAVAVFSLLTARKLQPVIRLGNAG
jgi:hypothetical protein